MIRHVEKFGYRKFLLTKTLNLILHYVFRHACSPHRQILGLVSLPSVTEMSWILPAISNKSFEPPRQSLMRRLAQIDHLLARQLKQRGDLRIFQR